MNMSQSPPDVYQGGNSFAYATPQHLLAAASVLPALGIIVVVVRFYTRSQKKVKFGIDDFLILPALLFVIGMGATIIAGVQDGSVGYPTPPPTSPDPMEVLNNHDPKIEVVQKVQFITQLLMVAAYGLIKLSVIFFYRRIFNLDENGRFNLITTIFSVLIGLWTIAYIFAIAFDCGTNWFAHWGSINDILTYCSGGFAVQQIVKSLLISDLITDVLILLIPMPKVWTLHLTPAKKLAVTGIFLLGAVATGAAIARLYVFISLSNRSAAFDPTLDENLSVSTVIYWSMIEAGLSLIAACLPMTQHIFRGSYIGSVVASVRSAISLPSITRSQSSRGSRGSNNRSAINKSASAGSFQRLDKPESITERDSHQSRGSTAHDAQYAHDGRSGVNRTVLIEMTSQEGVQEPKIVEESWKRP